MTTQQARNAAAVAEMIRTAVANKEQFAIVNVSNNGQDRSNTTFHFALKGETPAWSDKRVWSLFNAVLEGEPTYHWFYIAGFADADADTLIAKALRQLGYTISPLFQHPNKA